MALNQIDGERFSAIAASFNWLIKRVDYKLLER